MESFFSIWASSKLPKGGTEEWGKRVGPVVIKRQPSSSITFVSLWKSNNETVTRYLLNDIHVHVPRWYLAFWWFFGITKRVKMKGPSISLKLQLHNSVNKVNRQCSFRIRFLNWYHCHCVFVCNTLCKSNTVLSTIIIKIVISSHIHVPFSFYSFRWLSSMLLWGSSLDFVSLWDCLSSCLLTTSEHLHVIISGIKQSW